MTSVPGIPNGIITSPSTIAIASSSCAMLGQFLRGGSHYARGLFDPRPPHTKERVGCRMHPPKRTEGATAECRRGHIGLLERNAVGKHAQRQTQDSSANSAGAS